MLKNKKKLKELEQRISIIEKKLDSTPTSSLSEPVTSSYKEVIDEWLNGKKG